MPDTKTALRAVVLEIKGTEGKNGDGIFNLFGNVKIEIETGGKEKKRMMFSDGTKIVISLV